jgi:hypothetical protein
MSRVAVWRRWQAAAGPWRGYVVCPALQVGTLPLIPFANRPVPSAEPLFGSAPTAVIVDLDPVVGVKLAASMSQGGRAHVVLVLPRWPHTQAVLPSEQLLSTLVVTSRWLTQPPHAAHVMFVVDAERRKDIAPRPARDARVDNRYDLIAGDLPNLQTLRAAGIQRIVKVTRGT